VLDLSTTQPGLQLYTGNFLGGLAGRGDTSYGRWQALCLEPQDFPDAPNQPGFPSTTLEPGQQYAHTAIFRFGVGTRSGALPRAETR
jgi:aldose 1-epimerase